MRSEARALLGLERAQPCLKFVGTHSGALGIRSGALGDRSGALGVRSGALGIRSFLGGGQRLAGMVEPTHEAPLEVTIRGRSQAELQAQSGDLEIAVIVRQQRCVVAPGAIELEALE